MPSAEERFRAKVTHRSGHDLWTGAHDSRGVGMVRIDGKLRTSQRAAWEFAYGSLPTGARVNTCAQERACVTVAHLSLSPTSLTPPASPPPQRRRKGAGTVRQVSHGTWEITVSDGASPTGSRRRRILRIHGERADAEGTRGRLVQALARDDLGDLRVRELVYRFLEWNAEGKIDTIPRRDREVLEDIIGPALGHDLAGFVSSVDVETGLRAAHRRGCPVTDVRDALGLLRRAYRWADIRGWSSANPTEGLTVRDIT